MDKKLEQSFQKALHATQKGKGRGVVFGITKESAAEWHKNFLDADYAKSIGDRRYQYLPFHKLAASYQMAIKSGNMYPHAGGGKYNFKPEHYYYPVTKNGQIPSGGGARRVLAIPMKMIDSPRAMRSLGYRSERITKKPAPKSNLKAAEEFFYENAGYGYGPGETPEQGRRRGAKLLAKAEAYAEQKGWKVSWEGDDDAYSQYKDEPEVKEWLSAILRDEKGNVLGSLGSIGDPSREYGRVVEAELALEAMPKKK